MEGALLHCRICRELPTPSRRGRLPPNDRPGCPWPKGDASTEQISEALGPTPRDRFRSGAEGEILFFEANATMVRVRPCRHRQWDYRRPSIGRAIDAARGTLFEMPGVQVETARPSTRATLDPDDWQELGRASTRPRRPRSRSHGDVSLANDRCGSRLPRRSRSDSANDCRGRSTDRWKPPRRSRKRVSPTDTGNTHPRSGGWVHGSGTWPACSAKRWPRS